ncbi:GNAT family N-acetyltransferase [Streptomyces sp. 6N223]|uniref:GNAT family N-acetyltransferase n=1 Tax=Streptomyces sp. 6N223 TaxID=3457412 RepID=UPI003FD171A1
MDADTRQPTPLAAHWPLLGLRLTTPRLELRLPSPDELAEQADLAADGVHDPARMPFLVPWTDLPPKERARSVVLHHWRSLGAWTPESWSLPLAVFAEGRVVGHQSLSARDFAVLRQVGSGSWLGRRHQGRGLGTEMRAAVLHLAFAGLGAEEALSGAFDDNPASLAVSEKLGYERDGVDRHVVRGRAVAEHRLRLTRARWEAYRARRPGDTRAPVPVPVTVSGLDPCLPLFGVANAAAKATPEALVTGDTSGGRL